MTSENEGLISSSSAAAYVQSTALVDRLSNRASRPEPADDEPGITSELCFTVLPKAVITFDADKLRRHLKTSMTTLDGSDVFGRPPLQWAVMIGNCQAVRILLESGASTRTVDRENMTPLHNVFIAPHSSQLRSAELLLEATADVDALDFWGRTPLRIAVGFAGSDLQYLRSMIQRGADVNRSDITPRLLSSSPYKVVRRLFSSCSTTAQIRSAKTNSGIQSSSKPYIATDRTSYIHCLSMVQALTDTWS